MSYFGTIYADTELPSRARAVYMYLRDRADSEGKCWPGIKTIASDMRLSRSTVKRALTDLEQHGYLQKIPRYRKQKPMSVPTRQAIVLVVKYYKSFRAKLCRSTRRILLHGSYYCRQ